MRVVKISRKFFVVCSQFYKYFYKRAYFSSISKQNPKDTLRKTDRKCRKEDRSFCVLFEMDSGETQKFSVNRTKTEKFMHLYLLWKNRLFFIPVQPG